MQRAFSLERNSKAKSAHHHEFHVKGTVLTVFASLGDGVINFVAINKVFPQWGLALAVIIGVASFLCGLTIYSSEVFPALNALFGSEGLFKSVRRQSLEAAKEAKEKAQKEGRIGRVGEVSDSEIQFKQRLAVLILLVAAANGLGFWGITLIDMGEVSSYLFHINLFSRHDFLGFLAFFLLSAIAAVAYGLMIYNALLRIVLVDYVDLKDKVRHYFRKENRDLSWWIKTFLMVIFSLLAIVVSLLVTLATGNTWRQANQVFWQSCFRIVGKVANKIANIVIYGFFMPLSFLFDFTRMEALILTLSGFLENNRERLRDLKWFEKCDKFFSFVVLALHVVGEGAIAGQSIGQSGSMLFTKMSNWLGGILSPRTLAVGITAADEMTVDSFYMLLNKKCPSGHDHQLRIFEGLRKWGKKVGQCLGHRSKLCTQAGQETNQSYLRSATVQPDAPVQLARPSSSEPVRSTGFSCFRSSV